MGPQLYQEKSLRMFPELAFDYKGGQLLCGRRPLLMGILNVTPDSFSDGGAGYAHDWAVAKALALAAAGADVIDIGGESTRSGAMPVPAPEEERRVLPVIRALQGRLKIPISIDTWKAEVARAAVEAGASIVNDITGGHRDPGMLQTIAETGAGFILMHMRGTPETMQKLTAYADLVGDLRTYFKESLWACETKGIPASRVMFDPGIGFAKTPEQSVELIAATARFRELGRPILQAPSRKSFLGVLTGLSDPRHRIWGTAAAVSASIINGADMIRVHDVGEMLQAAKVAWAVRKKMDC